jgi:hypothetical protein
MFSLYYKIWVDAIVAEQSKKGRDRNWKLFTIIPISLLQGVNLLTILYWMKIIVDRNLPLFVGFDIFSAGAINSFLAVLMTFFIPFLILNYLLIFNNDRYAALIKQYPYKRGIIYRRYVMGSIGILIIPIIIQVMFFN